MRDAGEVALSWDGKTLNKSLASAVYDEWTKRLKKRAPHLVPLSNQEAPVFITLIEAILHVLPDVPVAEASDGT